LTQRARPLQRTDTRKTTSTFFARARIPTRRRCTLVNLRLTQHSSQSERTQTLKSPHPVLANTQRPPETRTRRTLIYIDSARLSGPATLATAQERIPRIRAAPVVDAWRAAAPVHIPGAQCPREPDCTLAHKRIQPVQACAAVSARRAAALRHIVDTRPPSVSRRADARILLHTVDTRATVCACALDTVVNVDVAQDADEAGDACAREAVDAVVA
jgi:hypothetical protein